jgi:hypothetical protein
LIQQAIGREEVKKMKLVLSIAAGIVIAIALAGPANAQDAPGHCPSITKAQMKQILAPLKRKFGARNVWAHRSYTVWSEQGSLWIYVYRPGSSWELRKGFPRHIPMKNLCPLSGEPSMPVPNWWPRSIPDP